MRYVGDILFDFPGHINVNTFFNIYKCLLNYVIDVVCPRGHLNVHLKICVLNYILKMSILYPLIQCHILTEVFADPHPQLCGLYQKISLAYKMCL